MLISGQSLCSGCGSDVMLWERVSLFTNITRDPGDTVTWLTLTPAEVIVIVVDASPEGPEGEPPPPHAAIMTRAKNGSLRTRVTSQ